MYRCAICKTSYICWKFRENEQIWITGHDFCANKNDVFTRRLNSLPVITWYAIFIIRPKCQQRTAIFAECEVSLFRFLITHRLYCWLYILCEYLIESDGKKCLYSRSFRFYKDFDVSEKNMGCLAQQTNIFAIFPLLVGADNIYKYKTEWF